RSPPRHGQRARADVRAEGGGAEESARAGAAAFAHREAGGRRGEAVSETGNGARGSIRRHILATMTIGILVVVGLGGSAMMTELSGAVVASGYLVVDTNVK